MNKLSPVQRVSRGGLLLLAMVLLLAGSAYRPAAEREVYQLKIYHIKTQQQEERVEAFLRDAFLPELRKLGVRKMGVFKPIGNDTATDRRVVVLIPYPSLAQLGRVTERLEQDVDFAKSSPAYWAAAHTDPPYTRLEVIQLESFTEKLRLREPRLQGPRAERVYELRSYESATEMQHRNKVQMFTQGGEIPLFERLGFNAVFYARVVAGSHMPNLMYLTTFENQAARDEHWKSFGADPEWKKLSSLPEYQNNVSKNDKVFLRPTAYSDI
ncbi:NIPSNAP family containing protein [Hymenobacter roseosalivarius DSM 11622]|uniref:NIPSNAP family containing protein n=1 Tax=Hymenobacter roseosalivarius DSM 11622 TaxID=645990 RepID=A0A1W1VYC0_9BACT|nr:NIPSNAP family protein [Hymenobacter roseosalivarius]SMB98382.1 NIPSNAP family containing protein [Hymenobacter roseosalivarius DSM 11622]